VRRRWVALPIAGFVVLAGTLYLTRVRPSSTPGPESFRSPDAGYVDPKSCAGCHASIWEVYRRTGMGRSFYRPMPENTLEDYTRKNSFYHKASDSYFTMLVRDGGYFQRRSQIGFDGKETNVVEKRIDFIMGSGNHVRTYLHRTNRNILVELPLAWYAEKGGHWAMNPGYDRPDHLDFRRSISHDCMFCHNGYPEIPPESDESIAELVVPGRLPEGIDCQRCHGPGRKHVQMAGTSGVKSEAIRNAIVNPSRLSGDREMEVCMQCHLNTTSSRLPNFIVRYERGAFSYKPGEPLADFMLHFDHAPGKGRDDKFEIGGAAYRLRRSACFQKSNGVLRCTTCHNPHDIRSSEGAKRYTDVCRQCHSTALDQLVVSGRHPQSTDCIGCHMPKRRTDDAVHVVMTDHYIQRRKPARDLLAEFAERTETDANAYHGEVVLYYPQEVPKTPENELYLAIAQVSQMSNLDDGIAQMTRAIEAYHPERVEYYLQLAEAWRSSGQIEKAIPLYEEAVRRKPMSLVALQKLGFSLRSAGQHERATEMLKRALDLAPGNPDTWHQLGLVYLEHGKKSAGIAALEKAVELDPDISEAYNSLGQVWFESGDVTRAESAFRSAIRIQPDYAQARSNLGILLSSLGRFPEARYHFEAALRFKPDYAAGRYNYGIALTRERRFDEAQRQMEAALRAEPGLAEAHAFLGNLLAMKGHMKIAMEHYQEAIRIRPAFGAAHLSLGEMLADLGDVAGALPHLQQAAGSSEPGVREEALRVLQQLRKGR
jgi:predicted CXXCH cytochrome family protein